MVTARVWHLPGYKRRPTLAHLGHIGERKERWGWFYLRAPLIRQTECLVTDPIGRLWMRGETPFYWVGSEPRRAPVDSPLGLAWWRFPDNQAQGERLLALWVPDDAVEHYLGFIEHEPFGHFQVKELLPDIPEQMRLEP